MIEFLIVLFVLYVLYKAAVLVLTVLGVIMYTLTWALLYTVAIVATIIKMVVNLYAKAVSANPVITIGSTCAAYGVFVVATH